MTTRILEVATNIRCRLVYECNIRPPGQLGEGTFTFGVANLRGASTFGDGREGRKDVIRRDILEITRLL